MSLTSDQTTALNTQISALQVQQTGISNAITNNTSQISACTESNTTLQTQLDSINTQIAALQSLLGS